jgi:hypothetical protein
MIKHMRYGRNANKHDLITVFTDNCGTCSTKHALLKQLADEQGHTDIQLILGLIKMSAQSMPEVTHTLQKNNLAFIPEAHNYLKYNGRRFDLMKSSSTASAFEQGLLEEMEIRPDQVTEFKVSYHQAYLKNWLAEHPQSGLDFETLWIIREQCIKDLGN